MEQIIVSPDEKAWSKLIVRPAEDNSYLISTVKNILIRVKTGGDKALLSFTQQFDGVKINELQLSKTKLEAAAQNVNADLKSAIDSAYENIKIFHGAQKPKNIHVETMPGVNCSLKYFPIENVGLYIPGGTAPLFSTVLMLGIPAQLAGSTNIYLCTPPDKNGEIHPAICYAALKCGIKNIYKVGGAQAIAAMAYGTNTIVKADKIFGPGNQYVTMAKQLVNLEGTPIDMPAGPSELAVYADSSSNPKFVAADLLSQAEHGPDSQVVLVTTDNNIIIDVKKSITEQLDDLPRKSVAKKALLNSKFIYFDSPNVAFNFINLYAPEHLIIASSNARNLSSLVKNAGSVFLGNNTPESAGDYASGTNHTLPTNGTAHAQSGITLLSFFKTITFQELSAQGVHSLASIVETMAHNEQLTAHKRAMELRKESL